MIFGRRKQPDNITYLAGLAKEAGDDLIEAVSLQVMSLPPDEKANLMLDLFKLSPTVVRKAILNDVLFNPGAIDEINKQLTDEDRRAERIKVLLEEGRQRRRLDLAEIPAETEVTVSLMTRNNENLAASPRELAGFFYSPLEFTAHSLGESAFVATVDLDMFYGLDGKPHDIRGGSAFTLSSRDEHDRSSSVVRFGASLNAKLGETDLFPHRSSYDDTKVPYFVSNISLDQQPAFYAR